MKNQIQAKLIQFDCGSSKGAAVAQLERLLKEQAPGADLLVLAETAYTSYTTRASFRPIAEPIPGPFTRMLARIARRHGVHICSGMVELEAGRIYNTAVLVGPDGSVLGRHRKTALAPVDELGGFSPGNGPEVVETALGRIGMLICLDSQDLGLISRLAAQRPELVLVPSYGLAKIDYRKRQKIDCMPDEAIDEWRLRMQALAKFCHSFVLRVDHVGLEGEQVRLGHSAAFSPGGYLIAEATMRPGCVAVVLKASAPDQRHW